MLRLRKSAPAFIPVSLGGDAHIRVRPATQTDVEYATANAQRDLAGLLAGSEAGPVLAVILGEGFTIDALRPGGSAAVACARLAEIYLTLRCQDGWRGVATEDGEPIAAPDAASLALLLADPVSREAVMRVINQRLHTEASEGNAFAASPSGGAAIPDGAPTAEPTAIPAPADSLLPETMEPEPVAPRWKTPRKPARDVR
jgi:hypothetical protein